MRALGNVKVYVAVGATDMRKAINGLTIMVEHDFDLDPFCGHLFAFCNRRRTLVKVLYWERNEFLRLGVGPHQVADIKKIVIDFDH